MFEDRFTSAVVPLPSPPSYLTETCRVSLADAEGERRCVEVRCPGRDGLIRPSLHMQPRLSS